MKEICTIRLVSINLFKVSNHSTVIVITVGSWIHSPTIMTRICLFLFYQHQQTLVFVSLMSCILEFSLGLKRTLIISLYTEGISMNGVSYGSANNHHYIKLTLF